MATEKDLVMDLEAPSGYGTMENVPARAQKGAAQSQGIRAKKEKAIIEHSTLYSMIRPHSHRWFARAYRYLLYTIVTMSVINYVLETEIRLQRCCTPYFNTTEVVVSILLVLEYIAKVVTAPQRKAYAMTDAPYMGFILSSESFIDIVSFLPVFIMWWFGLNFGSPAFELERTLRLVRLLKLPFTWESFRLVGRVFYFNIRILISSFVVCFVMLLTCSIVLYYTRPPVDPKANFSSILNCFYLSVLILTGQGIPDGVMPWYTSVVISITAIFAIAQFAIPASMLTWGFEQEAERNIKKNHDHEKKIASKLLKGKQIPESSSSSDASDRESEWEGYLEQVAGSDSESDSNKSKKSGDKVDKPVENVREHALTPEEKVRAERIFSKLDKDGDGLCRWEQIRAITDSEVEAKALLKQLRTFAVGDDVTMHDFIVWLSDVKTSYINYGDKVFLRLLNKMETMLSKTKATASWRKAATAIKAVKVAGKLPAVLATGAPAPATAEQEQLVQMLREKLLGLEGQLSRMKMA